MIITADQAAIDALARELTDGAEWDSVFSRVVIDGTERVNRKAKTLGIHLAWYDLRVALLAHLDKVWSELTEQARKMLHNPNYWPMDYYDRADELEGFGCWDQLAYHTPLGRAVLRRAKEQDLR